MPRFCRQCDVLLDEETTPPDVAVCPKCVSQRDRLRAPSLPEPPSAPSHDQLDETKPPDETLSHKDVLVVDPAARYEAERCETLRQRLTFVLYIFLLQAVLFLADMIRIGERPE